MAVDAKSSPPAAVPAKKVPRKGPSIGLSLTIDTEFDSSCSAPEIASGSASPPGIKLLTKVRVQFKNDAKGTVVVRLNCRENPFFWLRFQVLAASIRSENKDSLVIPCTGLLSADHDCTAVAKVDGNGGVYVDDPAHPWFWSRFKIPAALLK